jgi:hypothetical protein
MLYIQYKLIYSPIYHFLKYSLMSQELIYIESKNGSKFNTMKLSKYIFNNRLHDRVRIPSRSEGFSSSLCVQTSSEVHPASYPMGTGDSFPGPSVTLTTHPNLVPRSRMSRSYISSPPWHLHGK